MVDYMKEGPDSLQRRPGRDRGQLADARAAGSGTETAAGSGRAAATPTAAGDGGA